MPPFNSIKKFLPVIVLLFVNCGKKDSPAAPQVQAPTAFIGNVSQERATNSSVFHFSVSLSKTSSDAVTVHYATAAGTALANNDFIPVSGILPIPPNRLSANIDVTVTGDSLRKDDQEFSVQLNNP